MAAYSGVIFSRFLGSISAGCHGGFSMLKATARGRQKMKYGLEI